MNKRKSRILAVRLCGMVTVPDLYLADNKHKESAYLIRFNISLNSNSKFNKM